MQELAADPPAAILVEHGVCTRHRRSDGTASRTRGSRRWRLLAERYLGATLSIASDHLRRDRQCHPRTTERFSADTAACRARPGRARRRGARRQHELTALARVAVEQHNVAR
jgi:hypothetical protein